MASIRSVRNASRRLARRALLAVALVHGVVGCGGSSSSTPASNPPTVDSPPTVGVAEILADGVAQGVDGLWAYVEGDDGQATWLSSGIQDRDTLAPTRRATRFRIASISKLFIATASVKAVQEGLLRMDDTLELWLPLEASRIENAERITVEQLLQHRSGIPDFDSQPAFSWRQSHVSDEALLELIYDQPADFAPDSRYEYSNTNYLLLGRVLDAALGYDHGSYLQNTILSPLGLVDTFVLAQDTDPATLSKGYWDGFDVTGQAYTIAGGSMVSTARDVGVFLRALARGTLLNDEERARFERLYNVYGHSGWLPGYQSRSRFLPSSNAVVVVFANNTGGQSEVVTDEVFERLARFAAAGAD